MRKVVIFIVWLVCMVSCSEDFSDLYKRIDELTVENADQTKQNESQKQQNEEQQKQNDDLQKEADQKREQLDSINASQNSVKPKLVSMKFTVADNPLTLKEDVQCEILNDSIVVCWTSEILDDKQLIPRFVIEGTGVTFNEEEAFSGLTKCDFKKPVTIKVFTLESMAQYTTYVYSYTGLPVLWIETEGKKAITSKSDYLNAHIRLLENVRTRAAGDMLEADGLIKGRGNTTWSMDKKSYRLKFEEKLSLLDEPKDKSWVLLANYADKTMLRNQTAAYMGSISNLDYTPRFHFVDLMLNGKYNGTYQLGDKLKISKNRVNVGDDGFLLEIDARATSADVQFRTNHIGQPVVIKDPDLVTGGEAYNYVKDYVLNAESSLYSPNFTDPEEGWQKYMDMDSFVDWYLINEIAKNNDAVFFSSCFMNLSRNGKLKMGPIWDFDIAFGNITYNDNFSPYGFWIRKVSWYSRLFSDPAFVRRVKERFSYFYSCKDKIMQNINEDAQYLKHSARENDKVWHIFYAENWPTYDAWGNYQNEVQSLKEWLNTRFEWLRAEFDKM